MILSIDRRRHRVEPASHLIELALPKWNSCSRPLPLEAVRGQKMARYLSEIGMVAAAWAWSSPALATVYPMTAERWDLQGNAGFEVRDGRPVLRLGNEHGLPVGGGQANLKNFKFETGVFEFDMLITAARDFVGPTFRQVEDGFGEVIYFRPHLNGKPDAIQYTPVVNNNLAWQIFTGPGFEAETTYPSGQWMHVRTDVYENSATVSVDGKAVLHVPHLKGKSGAGDLGVVALAGGDYFSNFSVEPIPGYRDPAPAVPINPLPPGSITTWQVTPALTRKEAFARAAGSNWAGVEWTPIAVETNGVANLSKAGPDADDRHSFIARFRLDARTARRELMQFGFSDAVRIYLNGAPLYEGADLQFSRDYRFLGHVGFWDSLFLPLQPGMNDVAFVVTDDTNGGTAAAARFAPTSAIMIK